MSRPPLPTLAQFERMPWPARDKLATAYRMSRHHFEQHIRDAQAAQAETARLAAIRKTATLAERLLYTCKGCGTTRHLGLSCATCALFATHKSHQ